MWFWREGHFNRRRQLVAGSWPSASAARSRKKSSWALHRSATVTAVLDHPHSQHLMGLSRISSACRACLFQIAECHQKELPHHTKDEIQLVSISSFSLMAWDNVTCRHCQVFHVRIAHTFAAIRYGRGYH